MFNANFSHRIKRLSNAIIQANITFLCTFFRNMERIRTIGFAFGLDVHSKFNKKYIVKQNTNDVNRMTRFDLILIIKHNTK